MSERKLKAWTEAGLIDAGTAGRIRAWEAEHARPLGLWSLIGLAALAIGLGLISVVAANWDDIPGTVRLGVHFALMLGLGGFLWFKVKDGISPYVEEVCLFLLAALGLTFFGHVGQVYQTSSPLWMPLALWLALFAPLLLLRGRTWLVAALVVIGLVFTLQAHASEYLKSGPEDSPFYFGTMTALPALLIGGAAWMRSMSERPDFWRRVEQIAFIYVIGGASFMLALSSIGELFGSGRVTAMHMTLVQSVFVALAAGVVFVARKTESGRSTAGILALAAGLNLLSVPMGGSEVPGAILFMALWGGVAFAALKAGWRVVFQVAVAMLALRLIILNFQLASDLLGSGIGLILTGILTLGVAWVAVRISRKYAPKEDVA